MNIKCMINVKSMAALFKLFLMSITNVFSIKFISGDIQNVFLTSDGCMQLINSERLVLGQTDRSNDHCLLLIIFYLCT